MGSPRRTGGVIIEDKDERVWKMESAESTGAFFFFFLLAGVVCMMSCLQADPSYPPSIDPPVFLARFVTHGGSALFVGRVRTLAVKGKRTQQTHQLLLFSRRKLISLKH